MRSNSHSPRDSNLVVDGHRRNAGPASRGSPMNADDSAMLRDLLADNRTLLAYIRTALAFAGLGFAVAKFGLDPKMTHISGYLGTFMVLVGLLVTIIGSVCGSFTVVHGGSRASRGRLSALVTDTGGLW